MLELLAVHTFDIERKEQVKINGVWRDTGTTTITGIKGIIQPAGASDDLEITTEYDVDRLEKKVYTKTELKKNDIIVYEGNRYRVFPVDKHIYGIETDHYKGMMFRI